MKIFEDINVESRVCTTLDFFFRKVGLFFFFVVSLFFILESLSGVCGMFFSFFPEFLNYFVFFLDTEAIIPPYCFVVRIDELSKYEFRKACYASLQTLFTR